MFSDEQMIKTFRKKHPTLWWSLMLITCTSMLIIVIIIETTTSNAKREDKYDWIVIGGGPAGCLMAERLSASGKDTVLLLDSGIDVDDRDYIKNISQASLEIEDLHYGELFWQYTQSTSNEKYTDGKVLGGLSTVNDMKYVRGTDMVFNRMKDLTNLDIWDSENVMQAYREIETFHGSGFSPDRHGSVGELDVTETFTFNPQTSPTNLADKFVTAFERITGITRLTDYNDMFPESELGPFVSWQMHAKPNGLRESSSVAHLSFTVRQRKNLHIRLDAEPLQIIFDTRKRARAIRYLLHGVQKIASARTRIVLCADKYTSTLLQLSGVGDFELLENFGIPLVHNNPNIGRNLTSQQRLTVTFTRNPVDTPSLNEADLFEGGAWLENPTVEDPEDTIDNSIRRIEAFAINTQTITGSPIMNVTFVDLAPHKRGYIVPFSFNVFRIFNVSEGPESEQDVVNMRNVIKQYACELHKEYQGLNVDPPIDSAYSMITPSYSICSNDTAIDAFVRANMRVYANHWTSSCRMGDVVDGRGSVLGLRGLTIADTSILLNGFDGDLVAPSLLISHLISKELLLGNVIDN
jgi:choline dehydrogenase